MPKSNPCISNDGSASAAKDSIDPRALKSPHPCPLSGQRGEGEDIRILALCDSPTAGTGFGRVSKNILERWHGYGGVTVDVWAINFEGWNYDRTPLRLFPAGMWNWNSNDKLNQFLRQLIEGKYTHLWMLMDPHALSVGRFPQELRRLCKEHGIKVMLYYPVDAPLEREWLSILEAVDVAVTFTDYGKAETRKALGKSLWPIQVIPHGIDPVFRALPAAERIKYRKMELVMSQTETIDFIQPDDFLIVNVNKNEWRKDPLRSLEIVKGLREAGVPAKLVMRMQPHSAMGGIALDMAAKQLGLTYGKEWVHIGEIPDEELCGLYNAADLYLTTSLGEGWGLGVTEALACHTPVAMANHTSLFEIGRLFTDPGQTIWLPMEDGTVCGADTRVRRRVHLANAVAAIKFAIEDKQVQRLAPSSSALAYCNWEVIASQMFKLLSKDGNI